VSENVNEISNRDRVLAAATAVEPAVWERHIREFVNAFVLKERRERWLFLLLRPTEKTRQTSHKLWNDLNRDCCGDLRSPWKKNLDQVGVYDDFAGSPKYLTLEQSMMAGPMHDGIWSGIPGQFALFFFHEGEILECWPASLRDPSIKIYD
jgi:hypothetical protein